MRRTVFVWLLLLLLVPSLLVTAWAAELPLVVDNGALLSGDQRDSLAASAQALSQKYGLDIVILTEDTLSGVPIHQYADDYYDQTGYSDNGILLLLSMEEREWYFCTTGNGIYAFPDYALSRLGDGILPYLSDGDYYGAFAFYLESLPYYLDAYVQGNPVDGYVPPVDSGIHGETVYYESHSKPDFLVSLLIGVTVASVTLLLMRNSMNTKRAKHSAGDYLCAGSFRLNGHMDLFLYSNISKTRRQENNSSGSRRHSSSSGRSHGGRGGKF